MTTYQNHIKLALIALTAVILAACSGGEITRISGSDDTETNRAPTFSASSASISVQENTTGVIYTAQATDAEGNTITYSLSGGTDQSQFSISSSNGEVQFQDPPDYENPSDKDTNNVYEVQISASDSSASNNMTLTVTITDDPSEETTSLPLPTDFAATAGDANVTLTWTPADSITYTIYRSSDSACEPTVANISTNCSSGAEFANASSGFVDTGLSNGTTYYYWIEAIHNSEVQLAENYISATPREATTTEPISGTLNDTGINWDGNYSSGNNADCSSSNISAPQDCHQGRDATHNDDSDGHAGFSFTKLDSNGNTLAASATSWHCVQDNVTGLIWEVKTDDGGLHDKDDQYNWYNTDPATNGGFDGYADDDGNICYGYDSSDASTYCNTQAFTARVNAVGLCGFTDWRVPDIEELRSIVDYSRTNPSIDINYFPNTRSSSYWSASPYASYSVSAWLLRFSYGYGYYYYRDNYYHVRLVLSGQ